MTKILQILTFCVIIDSIRVQHPSESAAKGVKTMDMQHKKISVTNLLTEHPKNSSFVLHNHENLLEMLIFLSGDAEFRVEGAVYNLEPFDTVIASNYEMHRIVHHSDTPYDRIVINVPVDFFADYNCEEFSGLFFNRSPGEYNLISGVHTENTYFKNACERLVYYSETGAGDKVLSCVIIEMISILYKCRDENCEINSYGNKYIREVILYINKNLSDDISLDSISEHLFVNKSYLCRMFKKSTGYTVNRYIALKRLMYVKKLCSSGMSITDASINAGFGSYSNFYKLYKRENGCPPSDKLKQQPNV